MKNEKKLIPQIDGDWWTIAGIPDLGRYNTENQEPVDFGIWQAADQTWQLCSCVRKTGCGGKGRLLYRWQTDSLTNRNWNPMGIVMEADPNFGETIGGLQAPFVIQHENKYYMFYGDWVHICMAWSSDGKSFARLLNADNLSGLFTEGHRSSSRDPMVMAFRNKFYLYYTGVPEDKGMVYCRTSHDLRNWGESTIVSSGGSAGSGPEDAECPFVLYLPEEQNFYLFRVKVHEECHTTVYCSNDPLNFGIDDDTYKICTMPYQVLRILQHDRHFYVAALNPEYNGMRMAKLKWVRS